MATENILSISLKEYKQQIGDLQATLASLEGGTREYAAVADELNDRVQRLNEAMKVGKQSATAVDGSYNKLVQTMSKLKAEWRATGDQAKRNELGKQINQINNQLKDFDASIGNYQRNVGNYANAFKEGFTAIGGSLGGVAKSAVTAGQALKTAFISNPITATIAAIVGVITLLYESIGRSEETQNAWTEATAKFEPIINAVKDTLNDFSEIIIKGVSIIGDWVQKIDDAATACKKWWYELTGNKKALDELSKAQDEYNKKEKAYADITKAEIQLEKDKRDAQVKISELQLEMSRREEAIAKARKTNAAEYHRLLQEQKKDQEAINDINVTIAGTELNLAKQRAALSKNSKEDNDRLAKAQVAYNNTVRDAEKATADLTRADLKVGEASSAQEKAENELIKTINKKFKEEKDGIEFLKKARAETIKDLEDERDVRKSLGKLSDKEEENYTISIKNKYIELSKEITTVAEKLSKKYNELFSNSSGKIKDVYKDILKEVRQIYSTSLDEAEDANSSKEIFINEKTTERLKKIYKNLRDDIDREVSNTIDDIETRLAQAQLGLTPTLNINDFDSSLEKSGIEWVDNVKDKIQGILNKVGSDLSIPPNEAIYDYMSEQYKRLEELENEEITKNTDRTKEKNEILYEMDMLYLQIQLEETEAYYDRLIKVQENYVKGLTEGTEEYNAESQRLEDIKRQKAKETADIIIAQQKRTQKAQKDDLKATKKYFDDYTKSAVTLSKSIGSLMGGISDIMKDNIDQKVKNGEISEEEAEKEFERVKQVQLAELWINTIAGATGAFLQDKAAYPAPWNYIIAGVDMATTFATGIMQHKQIQQQKYGDTGGTGSISTPSVAQIESVAVNPLLNDNLDSLQMTSLNTENMANQIKDQRVFIMQSDIADSQQQVQIRQTNTSF